MTAPVANPALRRKITAHARPVPDRPDARGVAQVAFTRALRHAAAPFEGLGLVPNPATAKWGQTLESALAALPEGGLVAVLEEEGGARGLIALAPGMVDALVEVQTTGRVEQAELPARTVTRIDEALVRDFIDFTLAAFARETVDTPGRDWPERVGYGSRVRDRGQITLLLPEGEYLSLAADLAFDGVPRRTRIALVLPSGGAGPVPPPPPDGGEHMADPAWCRARDAMLDRLPLPLDAVLMRVTRPLAEVEGFAVGDLIPFGPSEVAAVTLETAAGAEVARGRLGQIGGRRALRLPGAPVSQPAPAPPAPAEGAAPASPG